MTAAGTKSTEQALRWALSFSTFPASVAQLRLIVAALVDFQQDLRGSRRFDIHALRF